MLILERILEMKRDDTAEMPCIWMGDESDHAEISAIVDTLELLRGGLDAQIKTLDAIQW